MGLHVEVKTQKTRLGRGPYPEIVVLLAARGESPPAFDEQCILAACVTPPPNTGGILGRRALPARRFARLGATPDFHHGLLGQIVRGRERQGDGGRRRKAAYLREARETSSPASIESSLGTTLQEPL